MPDLIIPTGTAAPPAPLPGPSPRCDAGLAGLTLPAGPGGPANPPFDRLLKESLVAEERPPIPEVAAPDDNSDAALLGILGPAAAVLPPQLVSRLLATATTTAGEAVGGPADTGTRTGTSAGTPSSPTALLDAYLARRILTPQSATNASTSASSAPAGGEPAPKPAAGTVRPPNAASTGPESPVPAATTGPAVTTADPAPAIAVTLDSGSLEPSGRPASRSSATEIPAARLGSSADAIRPEFQQPIRLTWAGSQVEHPTSVEAAAPAPDPLLAFDPSTQSFVVSGRADGRQISSLPQPDPSVRPFGQGRGSWATPSGSSPVGAVDDPRPQEPRQAVLFEGVHPWVGPQADTGQPAVEGHGAASAWSATTRAPDAEPLSTPLSAVRIAGDDPAPEPGVTATLDSVTEQANATARPVSDGGARRSTETAVASPLWPEPGPADSLPTHVAQELPPDEAVVDSGRGPLEPARTLTAATGGDLSAAAAGTTSLGNEDGRGVKPAATAPADLPLPPASIDQETVRPAPAITATVDAALSAVPQAPAEIRALRESGSGGSTTTTHRAEQSLPTGSVPIAGGPSATGPVDQVAGALAMSIREGRTEVTIHLRPNNLGAVQVRVLSGQDGLVIHLAAERDEAGDILRSQIGELRQALVSHQVPVAELHVLHNPPPAAPTPEQRQSWSEERTTPERDEQQQDGRRPPDRDEDTE